MRKKHRNKAAGNNSQKRSIFGAKKPKGICENALKALDFRASIWVTYVGVMIFSSVKQLNTHFVYWEKGGLRWR